MFGIDPLLATLLVAGGLLYLGYRAGLHQLELKIRRTIDFVMAQMVEDGFAFAAVDQDGDVCLIPLKSLTPDQLRQIGHTVVVDPSAK